MKRFWGLLVAMVFLIIADQMSKGAIQSSFYVGESMPIIDGFFNLTYVKNPGAAFGFMASAGKVVRQLMFLLLPVLFCGWIVYMLIKSLKGPYYLSLAYTLIMAGAVGNLIDRFSMGYVVDFFDFYYGRYHYPAFNIADSCICIAAGILVVDMIIQKKKKVSVEN